MGLNPRRDSPYVMGFPIGSTIWALEARIDVAMAHSSWAWIFINANDTAGYDKSKVECYNCHKLGDFARECRAPRSKEGQFRNQDNTRKQGNNEDTSSKAMLAIDGVGFDWSDMAEEQVQTNMALMAFSYSECDDLIVKLNQAEFTAATSKRDLATVEARLITYRKNEVLFSEEVAVLKREVACKDYEINVLKSEFEKVKQEKDGIDFKIEKFDKASKDLDQLLGSQITNKSKKGLGYSAVPPPHPLIYNRPKKLDLSYSGLDEFKEPEFKGYGPENSEQESNVVCDKKSDNSKENSAESLVDFTKPENHEKQVKKSVRYAKMYRSQSPRGNQRNWKGQKSNQLGKDFVMYNKACFICGSFNHLQINCDNHQRRGIVSRNNYNRVDAKTTHPSVHRNMSPKAVLLKTGLTPLNTARPVNSAHPKTAVHNAKSKTHFFKQAQSTAKRPFYKQTTLTKRSMHATNRHYYTVRPKAVNTDRSYTGQVNAVRVKGGKPQHDDKGFVDSGCSRHTTGNIAYLLYFKEFDGGYVAFGAGAYGGRITGKGTLKTNSLDFEDVYLGKFDGKSDVCFFVGYSLSSKAFRVYNTRTGRVEENLHIRFLENKPTIEGNGPKWLFDINSLTQSMNYVPVTAETSYFDSSTKGVENGEPKTADDAQKQVEDSPNNENVEQDKFEGDSSAKDVNAVGQHVNTACPNFNTSSLKLNVVGPSGNTASSNEQDSPKDKFTKGASHTLEATHTEFFNDEDEPEVDLGNILNSCTVPTTPNTRIHKDHPINKLISDVKSSVQTRRMTKPTSEQGFLSDVYEQKTHDTLNTCLYACFLSQIQPTSIAKALSNSSWVEAMQEELLNKKDERGIVIRNKARLVAQGHKQEEGIDYEEDLNSAILYGPLSKRLFTPTHSIFKDPDHPDKVYKVVKALYGLHQAPRAWERVLKFEKLIRISLDEFYGRTLSLRIQVLHVPDSKLPKDKPIS
ncbi:ribonuclease H-like domain-containing protein [Tanacetum coccineum]